MITLKKRPLITKPKTSHVESDSDEELVDSKSKPLPVVSSDFRIPWRKDKPSIDNGDFFVLDSGIGDEEPAEAETSSTQDVLKDGAVETKTDPVVIDDSLKQLLDKAICGPSFEKNYAETAKLMGRRAVKKMRKLEREKTKGRDWFDLPATELTDEAKADLELLQMRAAIDPLAFYRRNDREVLPKYFQVGRIVDAPEDFYSSRMTKKERKRTMLDELLNDQQFAQTKRAKFNAIQQREKKKRRGAFQHSNPRRSRKEKPVDKKRKSK